MEHTTKQTPEEITRHYKSAMASANLINKLKSKTSLTESEAIRLKANQDHLGIMLAKDYWTDEDLTPLQNAILP